MSKYQVSYFKMVFDGPVRVWVKRIRSYQKGNHHTTMDKAEAWQYHSLPYAQKVADHFGGKVVPV